MAAPPFLTTRVGFIAMAMMMASTMVVAFNPNGTWFDRMVIVVFENEAESVTHADPNFRRVEARGRHLTNYSAITHPSQPNYLAMVAGDTFNISDDADHDLPYRHLVDLLEPRSVTWRVYAESLGHTCNKASFHPTAASACGNTYLNGTYNGLYARKHNPLMSFTSISGNPSRCTNIVDAAQLDADVAKGVVPQFIMYIPTLCNDGHDSGSAYAGEYLSWLLDHKLQGKAISGSTLVLLVFDEGSSSCNTVWATLLPSPGFPKNSSATIAVGSTSNQAFNHYSILRTVEENWRLGSLGRHDASASSLF